MLDMQTVHLGPRRQFFNCYYWEIYSIDNFIYL